MVESCTAINKFGVLKDKPQQKLQQLSSTLKQQQHKFRTNIGKKTAPIEMKQFEQHVDAKPTLKSAIVLKFVCSLVFYI